ncbi:exodeoxyribonuclease V subunit alpha [Massilia sp. WF1]|uniref:exodeoxyribonuclease V subunit alpha n=1 Tax=unclassified Massilia TaxID=2609279 RepID=UPI00064941B9|nr:MULTISPECIES: exodeoxyribonuclease V subunit alpha [unclassified Massilia]ALK97811.1 exodeoxyribonuclease V subunit alpha [Massilia sp. WG5]KLU35843.1 exodeoxyribonuclease V subunit alpha [Massilia sp. WF1]
MTDSIDADKIDIFWFEVERLTEAGELRRLSGAFARFIASLGLAPGPLLLASLVLSELEGRGHSCLLLSDLAEDAAALLGLPAEEWTELAAAIKPLPKNTRGWITQLAGCEQVWQAGEFDYGQPLVLDGDRFYLRRYWRDETLVAKSVSARARERQAVDAPAVRTWLDLLFASQRAAEKPDWQKLACAIALRGRMAIITGGPGTGKTYTVARLLALLFATAPDAARQRIALAAPTGKAAARLKQSIDKALGELADKVDGKLPLRELTARMGAARTLHSLLGARPDSRAFAHHRGNPLDVDVLIVDEASMVHLEMMASLLDALPPSATLILLGDKDQLASVEAGAVLGDLCHDAQSGNYDEATVTFVREASGEEIPPEYVHAGGALAQQTVMLRHSRRFGGPIGQLALAVNAGDVEGAAAVLRARGAQEVEAAHALRWIEHAQQPHAIGLALEGYRPYLRLLGEGPREAHEEWVRAVLQRFEAFRILCAVREGEWGVEGLNTAIEQRLDQVGLIRRSGDWYVGRPVMVTRNDYATNVFNGDIGLTLPDPARPGSLRVWFLEGDKVRSVLATRLRHVETAYAMTVHKSQGSEFAHTVLALPKEGGAVLARELVYTGITRASREFTLLTPAPGVLGEAIARRTHRASGLRGMIEK